MALESRPFIFLGIVVQILDSRLSFLCLPLFVFFGLLFGAAIFARDHRREVGPMPETTSFVPCIRNGAMDAVLVAGAAKNAVANALHGQWSAWTLESVNTGTKIEKVL
jgi:hypothetical protein